MKKILVKLGMIGVLALLLWSCIDLDVPESVPTRAEEMSKLRAYLDTLRTNNYDIDTTDLGVYYVTLEEGEGDFPENGDTLVVKYAGYLINGFLFDASYINNADSTMQFVLGNPPMIPGWDDGVKHVREGGKVQMIIPSDLAFGEQGYGFTVGPYETLIFVVGLIELKQNE